MAAPIYPGHVSALYAWLRRHPMLVDGMLAAALVFGGVAPAFARGMFLGIPLAFGLAVPVVFRRKHPIAAYYTAVAAGGLQVALGIPPAATDVTPRDNRAGQSGATDVESAEAWRYAQTAASDPAKLRLRERGPCTD